MDKISTMVPILKSLSQKKANVDDVKQVFSSIANTVSNVFTVRVSYLSINFLRFNFEKIIKQNNHLIILLLKFLNKLKEYKQKCVYRPIFNKRCTKFWY